MYLDELDKRVDIILLYNGLLNKIKDKMGVLKIEEDYDYLNNKKVIQVLEELLPQEDKKC